MNGKTLRLLTSAKLWISFRTHLHSLKYLSSNNSSDGSNLFLNVDLEREYFRKLFLHLKFINFKLLMTPMLLFFNNASLKQPGINPRERLGDLFAQSFRFLPI